MFTAFREDEVFGSEMYNNTIGLVFGPTILGMHGKQHHDHRSLVSKAFKQSALAQWEPEVIDPICDQLVDEFKDDGEVDLVKAVTFEFPTRVTAALLGLPQEDLEMFRRLSLDLISITEDIEAGLTASVELGTYFQEQVNQRRSKMTDDIIGDLVAAEIDGEKLTDEAIISFLRLLLPAGLETTYRSSRNLLQLLLTHPDQLEALQRDRDLIPAAIEEGIRYETPLVLVARNTTRDVEMHGMTIPEGAQVNVCMGSANRDEKRWDDPGVFDIHRPRRAHISFAGGIHSCLGMHLARVETQGDAEQPLRSRDRPPAAGRRRYEDRRHAFPLAQAPPRDVPAGRMKSRAAILHDMGQQWSVEDFELDPPKAGEVLVEMAAAGLCHSDEHIRNGDMSASNEVMEAYGLPSMFPMIGGHEGAGVVLEVGEGVTDFAPGDHVVTHIRRRVRPVQMVQLRDGIHLRHGCAGDDSRHADGRDVPPSHHRRSATRPPVEGRRVLETHCGFDGFDCQDRSPPAAAADGAAVVRDSHRVRFRGEPRQGPIR